MEKKVIFFLNAKEDGSGDFAVGSKIMKILVDNHILKENITVILRMDNNFINDYINLNNEFKKNCLQEQKITTENLKLSIEDISALNKITSSICTIYKKYYAMPSDSNFCYERLDVTNLSNNVTHATKEDMDLNIKFRDNVLTILQKNLTEGTCSINSETLRTFYTSFVTNRQFTIYMLNVIKFFLNTDLSSSNYKYTIDYNKLTPSDIGINNINKENVLIITFLCRDPLIQFKEYKKIFLDEGGRATSEVFASGLQDIPTNLGINTVKKDMLKLSVDEIFTSIDSFSKIMTDNNYNVCYFGGVTHYPWVLNFIMMYKLKYFVNKIVETEKNDEYNIYIPYDAYVFIKNHQCTVKSLCDKLVITEEEVYFDLKKKVNLHYYKSLTHSTFINFIHKSQELCILTGDQSFYEGLSIGKKVLYDLLPHKILLYTHYLENMQKFSKNQTLHNFSEIIENLQLENADNFIGIISGIDTANIKSNALIIETGFGEGYNVDIIIEKDSFIFKNEMLAFNFECKYGDIKKMYDVNYDLIEKISANNIIPYNLYLNMHFNFDINFYELLTYKLEEKIKNIELSGGGDKYLKKYLKYKQKYLDLHDNNKFIHTNQKLKYKP